MSGKALCLPVFFVVTMVVTTMATAEVMVVTCPDSLWPSFMPHETDCSKYYMCKRGTPKVMHCPGRKHYQSNAFGCVPPKYSSCKDSITESASKQDDKNIQQNKGKSTTQSPPTVTDAVYGNLCPSVDKLDNKAKSAESLESEEVGTNRNDVSNEQKILGNDNDSVKRDSDELSTTESNKEKELLAVPSSVSPNRRQCPAVDRETAVHLPHESDCSKFYKCSNGFPYLLNCPDSLHFNAKLQVCDWPNNAGCTLDQTSTTSMATPKNTIKSENVLSTDEDKSSISTMSSQDIDQRCLSCGTQHWADDRDCRFYWKCVSGRSVRSKCPSNLKFNDKEGTCDKRNKVQC